MSIGHNAKGGSNMHFNHADPTKVNVSSLSLSDLENEELEQLYF